MFCPNCGIEVLEGAEFCKKCGTTLIFNENVAPAEELSPEKLRQQPDHTVTDTPKKKKSKKLPIILGVVAVLVLVVLILPTTEKSDDSNVSPVDVNGVNLSKNYENADEGFSFKYPSAYDLLEEELTDLSSDDGSGTPLVLLANEIDDLPEANTYIMVSKFSVGRDDIDLLFTDDEQFAATFAETFDGNASVKDTSVVELDGVPARKITYIEQDSQFGYESYFYAVGFTIYRVDFNWTGETPGNNQRFFDAIIGSYKITSQAIDADRKADNAQQIPADDDDALLADYDEDEIFGYEDDDIDDLSSYYIDPALVGRWRSYDGGTLEFGDGGVINNCDFQCWTMVGAKPNYIFCSTNNGRVDCEAYFAFETQYDIYTPDGEGKAERLRLGSKNEYERLDGVTGNGLVGTWDSVYGMNWGIQLNEDYSGVYNNKYPLTWGTYTMDNGVGVLEYVIQDNTHFDYTVTGNMLTVFLSNSSRVYTKVGN